MRALSISFALALVGGLGLAGVTSCSPFDPNLGDDPFLCGTDSPQCPDGYMPVNQTSVRCVCEKSTSSGGNQTAGCSMLRQRPLRAQRRDRHRDGDVDRRGQHVRIRRMCRSARRPTRDYYAMQIDRVGTLIQVTVVYDGSSAPTVDILDPTMVSVQPTITPGAGTVAAMYTSRVSGKYFALVKSGANEAPVDYSLDIQITPPT